MTCCSIILGSHLDESRTCVEILRTQQRGDIRRFHLDRHHTPILAFTPAFTEGRKVFTTNESSAQWQD